MKEIKASELREMSDEQLGLTLKEATENLFRLRLQAQTERLDVANRVEETSSSHRQGPYHPSRTGSGRVRPEGRRRRRS